MTPRERVLTAMRRQVPDKVPKTAGFTPAVQAKFEQMTGQTSPAEYFGFEPRGVGFRGPKEPTDWSPYFPQGLKQGTTISEYGTAHEPGDFYHFWKHVYPLPHVTDLRQLEDFPWPDFTPPYRHQHLEADVKRLHDAGWFVQGGVGHIWENAWQIVRMENLMMFMVERPELAGFIFDRITQDRLFMARRFAEAGCDMILTGDDVGMQDRLMMSVEMWRRWLKPCWRKVYQAAREIKPDILVFYHSDGDIRPIIPDLIEIGLDILNPVQPECMDPGELKHQYGDRLAFWGTIGTQTTMPFGTPEEVRATVKLTIETVGTGGGLLIAPTHVLEPDVPWENIVALFEAVEQYGRYNRS